MTELVLSVTIMIHIPIQLPSPPAPRAAMKPEERERSADENNRAA